MAEKREPGRSVPEALTRIESHDRIVELFAHKERGTVLDIPCGQGALAVRLKSLGFHVSCADIDPALFRTEGIQITKINLNEPLPYQAASFDYIACIAGIHRVYRLHSAVEEFYRILSPHGQLVISFPNYSNIGRRLKFLFTGSISKSVDRMAFHEQHTTTPDAYYRQALLFPQISFAMEAAGFRIIDIKGDKLKRKSLTLLPIILAIKAFAAVMPRKANDKYRLREMASNNILLGGNNLILTAVKDRAR
jgi:ubiquinone/menaquinone biosynthesis C-methylase UbiE